MLQGGVDLSYLRWAKYDGVGRERAQRPQLHRARLRPARRRRLLGPRAHRGLADAPGRRRLEAAVRRRRTGRALAAHRRRVLRAVGGHAGGRARGDGRGAPRTARACPTTSTTAIRCGGRSAARRSAREVNRVADAVRRRAVRQRGRLLGGAGLRARGRRPITSARCRPPRFRDMIADGGRRVPQHQDRRDHAAHRALGAASTAGAPSASTRGSSTRSPSATSRSSIASAAAIRSPPGFIYGLLAGKDPQWALECGVAHGALAMSTPGDTTMATLRRGAARDEGRRSPRIETMSRSRNLHADRGRSASCRSCARRRPSSRCAPPRRCWRAASRSSRSR